MYNRAGYEPIPLKPNTKEPAVAGWQTAPFKDLAMAWRQRSFFETQPGVGLRLSGLVVVDVEGPTKAHAGDPAPFVGTTPVVARTPSGGRHFFYRLDGEAASKIKALPGVDILTTGRFVAVWPTPGYAWEDGALEALLSGTLPGFSTVRHLVETTSRPAANGIDRQRDGGWVTKALKGVREGERNETCTRLAGYFLERHPPDIVRAMLMDFAGRCTPPLDPAEVETVVASIEKTRQPKERKAEETLRFMRFDEAERKASSIADRPALVEGWFPDRTIGLFGGKSQIGKTQAALQLSVSIATGKPFLGRWRVRQGPVMVLTAEDNLALTTTRIFHIYRGLHPERVREERWCNAVTGAALDQNPNELMLGPMAWPPHDLPIHIHDSNAFKFGNKDREQRLYEEVARIRPALLVLDPLKNMVSSKDYFAGLVDHMDLLYRFRDELGTNTVIITHVNKNPDLAGEDESLWGSSLAIASFDTRWIAKEVRATPGRAGMLIQRKLKVAPRGPLVLVEQWGEDEIMDGEFEMEALENYAEGREVSEHEAKQLGVREADESDAIILATLSRSRARSVRALHQEALKRGCPIKSLDGFQKRVERLTREGRVRKDDQGRLVVAEE
jgi:hypothetical protein